MASALQSNVLSSRHALKLYDVDPNVTTAFYVDWVDMRDYSAVMMGFFRTIGTSALQTFGIWAAEDTSGTNATEIKTGTVNPDAVGDQVWLECIAAEIAAIGDAAGLNLRYVSLKLQFATGTDEGVATYLRSEARFQKLGLTADIVA